MKNYKLVNLHNQKQNTQAKIAIVFNMGSSDRSKGNVALRGHVLCMHPYGQYHAQYHYIKTIKKKSIHSTEKKCIKSALDLGLIHKHKKYFKKFCRSKFANLVAYTVPTMELKDGKLYLLLSMFLFVFDDILDNLFDLRDESDIINYQKLDNVIDAFIGIIKNKYQHINAVPVHDFPSFRPLCQTLLKVQRLINVNHIDSHFFTQRMTDYLKAVVWEHLDQEYAAISQETYMFKRRHTIGFPFILELIFAMNHIKLSKKMREKLIIKRYMEAVCNILFLTNDVFSLRKELATGEVDNLVLIKQNELGGLSRSFQYVVKLLNSEIDELKRLGYILKKLFPHNANIINFILITENYIDGHLYWYLDTKRYGKIEHHIKKVVFLKS